MHHFIAGKFIVPTSTFFPAVMWPWLVRHLKEEDDEVAVVLSSQVHVKSYVKLVGLIMLNRLHKN